MRRTRVLVTSLTMMIALSTLVVPAIGGAPHKSSSSVLSRAGVDAPLYTVGLTLPTAPSDVAHPRARAPSIDEIRGHLEAGDTTSALQTAEAFVAEHTWGRDRDAAWLVIGLMHRETGRHNAASAAFTQVRFTEGALAPWGSFFEAEQDLARGKPWVAVKECDKYRGKWPEGPHAAACLRLTAVAHARMGQETKAVAAAEEYDEDHEDATIGEQIDLQLAMWAAEHNPRAAVSKLQELAIEHKVPLTGRAAEERLAELAAQGIEGAVLPDHTAALQKRLDSLLEARRRDEAMVVWAELVKRSEDDRGLQRWLEAESTAYGWYARDYDYLASYYEAGYERHATGDAAWDVYRSLARGGRYADAMAWAAKGQTKHGRTRHWVYSQEDVGRTAMLAGDYTAALSQFDAAAARGGWRGRRGRYAAAFAVFMAGDYEDAVTRFDAILERNNSHIVESHYWRSRAFEALGNEDGATADRAWILENDGHSWYALLVRQDEGARPELHPFARDGRWPGPELPDLPNSPAVAQTGAVPTARMARARLFEASASFSMLSWPMRVGIPEREATRAGTMGRDLTSPPASYLPSEHFDPVKARTDTRKFADEHAETWNELPAIYDMARAGLYDQSGPAFAEFYEDWVEAYRYRSRPDHAVARTISVKQEDWRPMFLYVRDHHHSLRFTVGMSDDYEDAELREQALKLSYPLAHDRFVWSHARSRDIDPYLVLGLMRQESAYDPNALSRAGARGAMQIMPRTGHLLADLAHDTSFTTGDLEDPILSIGMGLTYLGLLMERFDGVYPLAIASYNGGPHSVSRWLEATGRDMPMDQFVEHIPYTETRGYVMRVSEHYGTYLALYAPEGTEIVIPDRALGDDASVVDF